MKHRCSNVRGRGTSRGTSRGRGTHGGAHGGRGTGRGRETPGGAHKGRGNESEAPIELSDDASSISSDLPELEVYIQAAREKRMRMPSQKERDNKAQREQAEAGQRRQRKGQRTMHSGGLNSFINLSDAIYTLKKLAALLPHGEP